MKSYRKDQDGARPSWAETALKRSVAYLQRNPQDFGLTNPEAELSLINAEADSLGQTHLRLEQLQNGVPVFGGQLVTQLDDKSVRQAHGKIFKEARKTKDTTPKLTPEEAIERAKAELGHNGEFAVTPTAKLVILPLKFKHRTEGDFGATLCYQVELAVLDKPIGPTQMMYFVDAKKGDIVWYYDALPRQLGQGIGRTLYSGEVAVPYYRFHAYYLQDNYRTANPPQDPSYIFNMRNGTIVGNGHYCINNSPIWGNFTTSDVYSVAADAMHGFMLTWDYFLYTHGRRSINGNGEKIVSRVHYSVNENNAFWINGAVHYGDGDGSFSSPWATIDVAGHEITHGLTERTANLIYQDEPGAANESFSDIFGTAVEFYSNRNPDYLIGEDLYTPSVAGDTLRNMANPPAGYIYQPDHYNLRQYIGTGYDNGGVHINSGIQNKAFYLLAEGGVHPYSGIGVSAIGRGAAEAIFFRALVYKLFPSAQFRDVRLATLNAAIDLYGRGSAQYNSTKQAWDAVGVAVGEEPTDVPPQPSCDPDGSQEQACYNNGGNWDASGCYCWYPDPEPPCLVSPCY